MTTLTQDLDALLARCTRTTAYAAEHVSWPEAGLSGALITIAGIAYFLPAEQPIVIAAPDRRVLHIQGRIEEPMAGWLREEMAARLSA